MKISTKGRYALRVMIDLAEHNTGEYLAHNPEDYSVLSILLVTEGSLAPVACLEKKPNRCPKVAECKTLQMWEDFEKLVNDYFSNITIADLVNSNVGIDSYII